MAKSRASVHVLRTKLTRPALPEGIVPRPRLLDRFDPAARVVLVVAPPGFGKTTLVAQWAAECRDPLAWVSLDLLDETPGVFWLHLIEAVRTVAAPVDDSPRLALAGDPDGRRFLHVLVGQLEQLDRRAVVVLDGLSPLPDRRIADGLALLAERVGDRLQLVVTARVDPAVPLARWRTQGWLAEIRERHLRLSDDEALRVAATFGRPDLPDEVYLGLNRRADGWPIAFHLALVAAQDAANPADGLRAMAGSDRELSDYVVAEILDRLPTDERDVVLDLSVAESFDPALAVELAGPRAGAAVGELRRRRLLITDVPGRADEMRFHPLFRELLDAELRWRDPERHRAAHRRLADAVRRRDGSAAGRTLTHPPPADSRPEAAETVELDERLTSRELTILELLPTHLSYAQIAERLFLSVNTVKSNLKAVYRKLGVNTRSDAVVAGRLAGLL